MGRKKKVHTFSRFIERGNSTVIKLINLPDVRDVLVNADALKACLERSFNNLIKEHCLDDNMLKKFISICTDWESTNIGCNDSLFTRTVEEQLLLRLFWCILHQLELAIKESIAKGLLNECLIKECLMNLYYLYNKSAKKLRSSKKTLIDKLDGFAA